MLLLLLLFVAVGVIADESAVAEAVVDEPPPPPLPPLPPPIAVGNKFPLSVDVALPNDDKLIGPEGVEVNIEPTFDANICLCTYTYIQS